MNSLEGLSNNCPYTEKIGAFCSPVSRWSWSILFACEDYKFMSLAAVSIGCIANIENLSSGYKCSLRPNSWSKLIYNPCVCKSPSGHNLVVTSSRSISIEVGILHPFFQKISCSRRIFSYISGRRDMVRCNWVSKATENICSLNIFYFG